MTFADPQPFEEALKKLDDRTVVTSRLRSDEWRDKVAADLRDRAFFSSTLENARVAQAMKDYLGDFLAKSVDPATGGLKAQGRAEFVADLREICLREGLGKVDPSTGDIDPEIDERDLTDLRSMSRLQLIFDVQTESAHEYGYWSQGNDPDLLYAFPAQRFIRVRPVKVPRPYHAANEGVVRRKDDLDFWLSMNPDFGVPYGPWGFNSGMGVEDVDRLEAIDLGIISEEEEITAPDRLLNDTLAAGVRDLDPDIKAEIKEIFGPQIRDTGDHLEWTGGHSSAATPRAPIGGIASLEQAREVFREDYGTRMVLATPWGSDYGQPLPEFDRIVHARRVAAEMDRLQARWPALRGKLKGFANNQPKGALGWADVGSGDPHLITFAGDSLPVAIKHNIDAWEASGGDLFAVASERRASPRIREDIFRHELGHAITRNSDLAAWPLSDDDARAAISHYAGENAGEAIAEAFCLYTREDYKSGSLPTPVEALLETMLQ